MKDIRLKSLTLNQFAGINRFAFTPAGEDATIRGANGTGKSTLAHAYNWLLFNKDSHGRTNFDIIELDAQGKEVPMQDATVTGVFSINTQRVEFRKTFKQKWTRPRGKSEQEFGGHETLYWIDDIPMAKKEFEKRVNQLASEDAWRLVSDPRAFSNLHWKERRETLLSIIGGVTNADVAEVKPQFSTLITELQNRDAEEYKRVIMARRKNLNDELTAIPVRMDEARRSLVTVATPGAEEAVSAARLKLAEATASSSNEALVSLSRRINDLQFKADEKAANITRERKASHRDLQGRIAEAENDMGRVRKNLDSLTRDADIHTREIDQLRLEWQTLRHTELSDEVCTTCGQALPEGAELAATRRANALKRIDDEANELVEARDLTREAIQDTQEELKATEERLTRLNDELLSASTEEAQPVYPAELADLQAEYAQLKTEHDSDDKIALRQAQEALEAAQFTLAEAKASEAAQARVEELTDRQRKVSQDLEATEAELYLTEEFIRARAELLETRVNSYFPTVRFKLFHELVNGGLEETCEVTLDGVPFASLNTAAQVHTGIEIINALISHTGVTAPIIIDGRESVTNIPDTPAQVINLMVDPSATALVIE